MNGEIRCLEKLRERYRELHIVISHFLYYKTSPPKSTTSVVVKVSPSLLS